METRSIRVSDTVDGMLTTPGLLPEPERTIFDGVNSQTGLLRLRWGDYSALSVDPVDDCTFWYTNHVAGVGGTGTRPTRIASFRFGDCKYCGELRLDRDRLHLTRSSSWMLAQL
jgi:hypothetical protein